MKSVVKKLLTDKLNKKWNTSGSVNLKFKTVRTIWQNLNFIPMDFMVYNEKRKLHIELHWRDYMNWSIVLCYRYFKTENCSAKYENTKILLRDTDFN